jgi:RNA polymerase sigma-70 factor (ECF subfamily)
VEDGDIVVLVRQARQGDGAALAQLYRSLGPRVLGLSRHLLGSTTAAEDARNEVFGRLPESLGSYDPGQPFVRWLLAVTSHHCLDLLRRRRVERRLFADGAAGVADQPAPEETAPSPLRAVELRERQAEVREAIAALPEAYRLPLVLRYYRELSYDEIAAELGLTRNHVATLLFRAKQALRRRLGATRTE